MEEENLCASLTDLTESVLQSPQQESRTAVDHQCINGEKDAIVWGDTEVHINQTLEVVGVSLSPKAGQQIPEEAEEWEQMIWPMSSITCTSPPFSFATVQWDDASAETPPLVTDSSLANELCSGGATSPESTSPSPCQPQDVAAELFEQVDNEEEDGFDSQLLDSDNDWTGNYSEPCDAADVNEPNTPEKEDSAHELLACSNEVTQRTDSEEEEEHLIDTAEVAEGSEDTDTYVDVKLEEEQEEVCNLLGGQEETEGGLTSLNGVKTEEENKNGSEDEERCVTNVSSDEESETADTDGFLTDVEVPEEPLQSDTELNTFTDKLTDLEEPKTLEDSEAEEDLGIHEGVTDQTEETDMCEDEDQNVEPDRLETGNDNEETLMQEAEHAARTEDTQQEVEVAESQEDTNRLEQEESDQEASQDSMASLQPEHSKEQEMTDKPEAIPVEVSHQTEESDQLGQSPEEEVTEESAQPENGQQPEESIQTQQTDCVEADDSRAAEPQTEPSEQDEQTPPTADSSQPTFPKQPAPTETTDESEQLLSATELIQQQTQDADLLQVGSQAEMCDEAEDAEATDKGDVQSVVPNGEQHKALDKAAPYMNGEVDREKARRLAEQLFKLDGIQRADVVKHLDKNNAFSHAVGEEYLKFFDFTGQTLDLALRSFLKVVILIGETQERERVLQHFSCRFHQCNPDSFVTSGAVLALTCALMLLNTDLHGQNVGKPMSSSKFVSNLDGMDEGGNFSKDLLKSLYNSIKSEALEWAVDEEELKNSVLVEEDKFDEAPLRSKANPFLDVPHDKNAAVVKEGFLQRKLLADIDGKRTPWGKRSWKTFYGLLKGMVLYLQKDNYCRDHHTNEEVVSVHHCLAEQAADYTKKPHVFRLQTADWRVFLFQASSKMEMHSWISRINLVSALHSAPPFPAAVGSQRRFCRPILPASQSVHTLEHQLQSHAGMLESFKADILYQQQNPPEGKKAKARDLEEHRLRTEYLHHEVCRYEMYIQVLEAWKSMKKTEDGRLCSADLNAFDKTVCADFVEEDEEEGGLKKSHSSPSLELELAPPTVIKVRRNISERRTYRRTIVPRMNKEI